jgi:hypothetical protein
MNRFLRHRNTLLLAASLACLSAAISQGAYYVEPLTGSDSNPGTEVLPFRTIARAGQSAQPGDLVFLRGGTYRETFAPSHSGKPGNPIVFAAYPNENVTISGYDVVNGWTSEGSGIYQAPVSSPAKFHVLINGESAIEARWPNHNSWEILESPRGSVTSASNSGAIPAGHDTITDTALPGSLPDDWLAGARVSYKDWYRAWSSGTKSVTAFNPVTKSITLDSMIVYSDAGQFLPSGSFRYELYGSRGLIDVENEWAYVPATGKLHLKTPGGVDPSTLLIESSARDITVNLSGRSHIRLENVRIIGGSIQSDNSSSHCVLNRITMRYATRVSNLAGSYHEISDSDFSDSLEGSLEVKGTRQRIVNNRFNQSGGRRRMTYLAGNEHLFAYNSLSRSYDSILVLSANWRCRIVHNEFSDGPLRTTDMGMIYTVFNGGMSEIAYNRFMTDHRKLKHTYGIYLDAGASHYLVHHNVSYTNMFNVLKNGVLVFNNTIYRWADYGDGPADPLKRQSDRQGTSSDFAGCMYLNNLYGYTYDPIPGQPAGFFLDKVHANTVFNDSSGLPLDSLEKPGSYDFTLRVGSPAIDAGTPIQGVTDGFSGAAPDLGAYESGQPAWKAGHDFTHKPVISYDWPADLRISRYANLLRNGSFDDPVSNSTLFPWTTESGQISRYQSPGWTWPPEDLSYLPYGSMRLGRGTCGATQQVVDIEGGRTYAFTVWVRPTSPDQTFEVGVRLPDQSIVSTTRNNLAVGSKLWTRIFVSFTLPAGNHTVTPFVRKTSMDGNFAYVDEAMLSESFAEVVKPPSTPGATSFTASDDTYTTAGSTEDASRQGVLVLRETGATARKPYFKFDLSAYAGRTVQQAILHLYGSGEDRLWNVAVQEVTSDWSSTGPNPITAANTPTLGSTLATFQAQGSTRGWLPLYAAVNLTSHVNTRLASGGLLNLSLDDLDNSGKVLNITSSDVTSQTPPHAVGSPRLDILFARPPIPSGFNASGSVAAPLVHLSWTASPDALNYEIRRATSVSGPFQLIATVTGNSWQDPAAVTGTPYFYTLTGTNEAGSSPASTVVSATVLPISDSVTTTGASFDMSLGSTWDDFRGNDIVPNNTSTDLFVPVFDVAGTYTAPTNNTLKWRGLRSEAAGTLEINPASGGNSHTIHLGIDGISGTQNIDRLGAGLTIHTGTDNQTWSVELPNVQAAITGSATVTYTHPNRMWLRGANFGFTGIWKVDGGFVHPDANAQWSGASGALGQLINHGTVRLSNSVYDRVRLELRGSGKLMTSGNSTDNGAVSTLTVGSGSGTGDITGNGDLTITSSTNYGKILINGSSSNATADLSHTGDTLIDNKTAGMTLELGPYSTATFVIGAHGVNNRIRGLHPANSRVTADGRFIIQRSEAAITHGNSWTLVDTATLTATFGSNFNLPGFARMPSGVWTLVEGTHTWTFTESTGILSLAVPSPALIPITTTGLSTSLDLGTTWDDIHGVDIIPNRSPTAEYLPVFDQPGIYTAAANSVFDWNGMQFTSSGVELNPASGGGVLTINLGSSGISGTSIPTRLGTNLRIHVGTTNQTWTSSSTSQWNIQAAVSGSASITLSANAAYWFRGNNSNFNGTWILTSGTFQTTDSTSLGSGEAEIELGNHATLRLASGTYDAACKLAGNNSNLLCSDGATANWSGSLYGGTTHSPKTLNLTVINGATASTLQFLGDLSRHVGPIILARTNTNSSFSVNFNSTSMLLCKPESAGIVNGVNTTATPLIRPGTGNGNTLLSLNGMMMIDLSGASIQHGNQWQIVNIGSLNTSFGNTFSIPGFNKVADTWTRNEGRNRWTFSQTTGVLSLSVATSTAYSSWASSAGLAAGGNDDPALDPDHDGLNNLGEFGLDGNPLSPNPHGKLSGRMVTSDNRRFFTLTLPVRNGATFSGSTEQISQPVDGIIYHIQGTENLTNWNLPITEVTDPDASAVQAGMPALSPGWTYRSFRVDVGPGAVNSREFLRAAILIP